MEILFLSFALAGVVVGSELSEFVEKHRHPNGDAADCAAAGKKPRIE